MSKLCLLNFAAQILLFWCIFKPGLGLFVNHFSSYKNKVVRKRKMRVKTFLVNECLLVCLSVCLCVCFLYFFVCLFVCSIYHDHQSCYYAINVWYLKYWQNIWSIGTKQQLHLTSKYLKEKQDQSKSLHALHLFAG